jgi:uncharacterized membrane protein
MAVRTWIHALLTGAATLVVAFVLTNVVYMEWASWRYPQTSPMSGMCAFVLAIFVAPLCALIGVIFVFIFRRSAWE